MLDGPNGMPQEGIIVNELPSRHRRLQRRPDPVNDRVETRRLAPGWTRECIRGRQNGSTPGVAEHHDEACAEPPGGELDAADLGWGDDVPGNADDEQVTKALVEDDLRRHTRIRTSVNAVSRRRRTCGHGRAAYQD